MSRGLRITTCCVAAAMIGVASGPALAGSQLVKGSSGPLAASMKPPPTHTPKANAKVPLTVTATLKGKPARATAAYEFLYSGQVVSTQYPNSNKHFHFTGRFSDDLVFPKSAIGQPLTLRVVIRASGHTVNLNWAIKVRA